MPDYHFEIGGDDSALLLSACVTADNMPDAVRILRERIARPQDLNPTGIDATTHAVVPRAGIEFINLHIVFSRIGHEDIQEVRRVTENGQVEVQSFDITDDVEDQADEQGVVLPPPTPSGDSGPARLGSSGEGRYAESARELGAGSGGRSRDAGNRGARERDLRRRREARRMSRRVEVQHSVRFACPELFARDDFRRWLNAGYHSPGGRYPGSSSSGDFVPVATWHRGGELHSGSDVFMYYDHGELSDSISDEVDEILLATWQASGAGQYGVLWLVNMDPTE